MKFRKLYADEIECRIGQVKEKGLSLLLYKDARVDMTLLDETVGALNWTREHKEIKGIIYCTVSIYNELTGQWVSKTDCGTESNTEKEKGESSDSFKRACFNWGIGRELYTSPFIWINASQCSISKVGNSFKCYDKFKVEEIGYDERGRVNYLTISCKNKIVFKYDERKEKATPSPTQTIEVKEEIPLTKAEKLFQLATDNGYNPSLVIKAIQKDYGKVDVNDLTDDEYNVMYKRLSRKR